MKVSRRKLVLGVGLGIPCALLARPAFHVLRASWRERGDPFVAKCDGLRCDDSSGLDGTSVAEVVTPRGSPDDIEHALRAALGRAAARNLPVSIAGARHTQGGHTLARGGIHIDTSAMNAMTLDAARDILTVGCGARWKDVIARLDPENRAVLVMQSNDAFSIGGSLGANCHGWQPNRPPLASTIESFRLMLATGDVLRCSRVENAELFSLVMGGYGLFGIILDVELHITKNAMLAGTTLRVPVADFVSTFRAHATGKELAFGRLDIAPSALFEEAIISVYEKDASQPATLPRVSPRMGTAIARALFRGEVDSDYGKELRWKLEQSLGSEGGSRATRNQIMSNSIDVLANARPDRTDVLQEYFVPEEGFSRFVGMMRDAIRAHPCDLLNVTVRNVERDDDAFLRYAKVPVFGFVMFFTQARTPEADAAMVPLGRALIDAAIACGGRHYLPYRLHATREQLKSAYPEIADFFAAKRRLDPKLRFRNLFWDTYAS